MKPHSAATGATPQRAEPAAAPPAARQAARNGPGHAPALADLLVASARAVAAVAAGRSLDDALAACPAPLRPGAQALSFHTLRHLAGARAALKRLAPRPPAAPVQALLQVALAHAWPGLEAAYEDHTLVDQAVAAARKVDARSAGFVNAVLRRFLREREALAADLAGSDPAVRHGHPAWWIERLRSDWPDDWAAMLARNQQPAPLWLRANARRIATAELQAHLAAAGIDSVASPRAAQALWLPRPLPVTRLPGFEPGWLSVQDLHAQLAAPLLLGDGSDRLPAGARVLDACAAPGGKTAHLLEQADLDLLALDRDAERLQRVRDNLARLGLQARTRAADAARPDTWWDGTPFDAILLDAPCSASGIVRRHPDVRWLRRPGDVDALVDEQARLLDALWPLLAPGGRLIYATCSVFRDEGERQIEAFLQRTPQSRSAPAPGHLKGLADNPPPGAQTPLAVGDGFFYARVDKIA